MILVPSNLSFTAIDVICSTLNCKPADITVVKQLGSMTNRNVVFKAGSKKMYVLRNPGEGTSELVDRTHEYETYQAIAKYNFSDELIMYDKDTGIKITKFVNKASPCKPENMKSVAKCMSLLRSFHSKKIKVSYGFDLYEMIDKYKKLMHTSKYKTYDEVKDRINQLVKFLPITSNDFVLCHIDPNPDNFLITNNKTYLIDWEYAGMQDPLVDVAMFAIYSGYSMKEVDSLLRLYLLREPASFEQERVYAYIAICGLLWSNWCEYKQEKGVYFGTYAYSQFAYASEFSRYLLCKK